MHTDQVDLVMKSKRKTVRKRFVAKRLVRRVQSWPWVSVLRRKLRKKRTKAGLVLASLFVVTAFFVYQSAQTKIDPMVYQPLLTTIAKGESKGNYNAYFGNIRNDTVRFTDMTIAEVMQWQEQYVREGSISSAVGKYQIIRPTLNGLVQQHGIDVHARFDEAMQDHLAVLLLERRGAVAFVEKKISREQFAANLAKEWASLPRITGPNPHESYYAHDGVNKAFVTSDEVFAALNNIGS